MPIGIATRWKSSIQRGQAANPFHTIYWAQNFKLRHCHFSRRGDFLRGTQVTEFVPNKLDKSSGVADVVGLLNCVAEDGKRALLACHVTAIGAERSTIASAS
jgi:hypothetical protein